MPARTPWATAETTGSIGRRRAGRMRWLDRAVRPPLGCSGPRVFTRYGAGKAASDPAPARSSRGRGPGRRRSPSPPRVRRTSAGWLAWVETETEDGSRHGVAFRPGVNRTILGRARSDDAATPVTLYVVHFCGGISSPLLSSRAVVRV